MLLHRIIDVIVPIHEAHEELVACLASVQKHSGDYRLILIDDGSTDERIGMLFRRFSAARLSNIVLLRNARELGFAATANRGMAFSRNDVVLLSSDTTVTHAWLDKMRRCAASDSRIGTITPFSNNAEICSFPQPFRNNPAPDDPELINRAMELAAVPIYPDIPTAVGFCTFIRRRLIREIGLFHHVPPGLGEEQKDFSMRAREAGYRNVLCDDTFVGHQGAHALWSQRQGMGQKNRVNASAMHAAYAELVREFIERDPVKPIRSMVCSQVAVLVNRAKPGILHVLHPRGGGTEKYVGDLIAASRDDCRHYLFRILHDRWLLIDTNSAAPATYGRLRHGEGSNGEWLRSLCSWLRIDLAHVHSLIGSGDDLLQILEESCIPYCYSVHDMFVACPTIYLINNEREYCDATTDSSVCGQCLSKITRLKDIDVVRWRARYRPFLDGASKILAPSKWARDTLAKYYPGINVAIVPPLPELECSKPVRRVSNVFHLPSDDNRHIGVLGAIGPEKGARHLRALVANIRERRLPLRMVVVGYTDRDDRYQSSDEVLTIHGPYRRAEIAALLDYYRVALLVFPTVWPETFSYTLSEGWMAGRPALVPPSGALQERVLATGAGWIMDGWPNADSIVDQLMELTAPEYADELKRKAQLANAACLKDDNTAEFIGNVYSDMLADRDTAGKAEHEIARRQIYETACCAQGMEPLRQPTDRTFTGSVRRRVKMGSLFRRARR